jgi:hypothetical protein
MGLLLSRTSAGNIMDAGHDRCCYMLQLFPRSGDDNAHESININLKSIQEGGGRGGCPQEDALPYFFFEKSKHSPIFPRLSEYGK